MSVKNREDAGEKLPAELKPLFWEYDFGRLRWERDRELVIGKILASGELDALRWLRRRAGDDALREWLQRWQGAGLSPPVLRFFELILDIPHQTVSDWLLQEGRQVWDHRTH